MQLVIQFQTSYNTINMLRENKGNEGITEVKIAQLILFNLSFRHVTPAFELVTRAG